MMPTRPEDEDAADARRVLAGNLDAFDGIVQRWQRRMINLAWRFCRDRMTAEDMAQDAFVRAFRALHTFRGESAFSTWMMTVAMNSFRSWLRDRGPLPAAVDLARMAAVRRDPVAGLEDEQRASAVRDMVRTLPPRYREAIVLYYFEEMNLADTARILGIAEGTLKARLHRGRALLKRRSPALLAATTAGIGDDPEEV
jgi:RNA polymerase sigma-70 factor (ECF subfamily)